MWSDFLWEFMGKDYYIMNIFSSMSENRKIIIAPHTEEHVGKLGINQFADDVNKIMLYNSSWDRHWRRNSPKLDTGDIMIFSFKDRGDWYVVGDAVLLYDGFKKEIYECGKRSESGWESCYHFSGFRLYSKYISYEDMNERLSVFKPDLYKVVYLTPNDYVQLLSLTVEE